MKIVYASFKGYIGFYAKMGLEKLEIDFSKSRSNIILIVGMNGSGKSTLLNALNVFPDPGDCFMPDRDGEKFIRLVDNGNVYEINIFSPSDGKGGRKTTKAFISLNGTQLNENGNVTSYKEIVMDEFDMDPNFITLSLLTSIDRGLGDKRPAERKKFVGSVIDNLVTYNNIYKILNKKSLLYKSHINTIHTKIQTTGDKAALEASLGQLTKQANSIKQNLMDINNTIVAIEAKNSINEEEAKDIQELNIALKAKQEEIDRVQVSIDSNYHRTKVSPDEVQAKFADTSRLYESHKNLYESIQSQWTEKSNSLAQMISTINQLEASIPTTDDANKNLSESYAKSTKSLKNIEHQLSDLGFDTDTSKILPITDLISKYEMFIQKLDHFYDGLDDEQMSYILHECNKKTLVKYQEISDVVTTCIEDLKQSLDDVKSKMKIVSVIEERPAKCKIDTCPFIQEAVKLDKEIGRDKLADSFIDINSDIDKYSAQYTEILQKIDFHNSMLPKRMELDALRGDNSIIEQLESIFTLTKPTDFEKNIETFNPFNDRRDPRVFREVLILLQQYESEKKSNDLLKVEYEAYEDKIKLINSTNATLKKLKEEEAGLEVVIQDLKVKLDGEKDLVEELQSTIYNLQDYDSLVKAQADLMIEKAQIEDKLSIYQKKSSKALESVEKLQSYRVQMDELQAALGPVESQMSDISGKLLLLDQYTQEYANYNNSYQIIETLKKYCSPTGGGIQTFFMQLYMAKTLELSNQILSMLFGGEYRLADFVINENEFRIPFIGSGMMVDDISSGSNSQIAMMGMVINLVLLHQASTKFNIAFLDEIDAGLDHRNRFEFVQTLHQAIPLLGIEQVFMISHSMEADTSSTDIIKLMTYDDFEDTVDMGNVIYDYQRESK